MADAPAPRAFMSHSSADKERFVLPFATRLRAAGIDVWVDRWEMLPERYVFLAIRAFRKELIDRRRLAEFLRTTEEDSALQVLMYVGSVAADGDAETESA